MVRRRQAPPPETPPPESWPDDVIRPPMAGYRPGAAAEDAMRFLSWSNRRRRWWLAGAGLAERLDGGRVRVPAKTLRLLDAERRRRWPLTDPITADPAADTEEDDDL